LNFEFVSDFDFRISDFPNPMSLNSTNDEDLLREELVAYLDGELDAEQSRRIELRASEEPRARRMLQELDRTWHMLDELDAPATSEDFTRTTLEMVAQAADQDVKKHEAEAPWRRRRAALWTAAGLIAAAAAGFLIVASLIPEPNAQLLQDLPIIENFDQYREIGSVDFLHALNKEKLFTEDADDAH
jgi:anti-sigma-K factor RskA